MTSLLIILLVFIGIAIIGGTILLTSRKVDADHAERRLCERLEQMRVQAPIFERMRREADASLAQMVEEGNKQATAARRGNLREIERGNRPLTVREIVQYAKQLPPPDTMREMNYKLLARSGPPPPWSDVEQYEQSVIYRQLFFRKELLRIITDQRSTDQRSVLNPYYRPPDFRDYREQSVWVYDGVVVLTPLTIDEEYREGSPWQFGADVRPHLERRFGKALNQLSDPMIEEAFQRGVTMMRQEGLFKWK